MYFVYILQSLKDNKRYIGSTNEIQRRVEEHNSGKVKSTRNRIPLRLIHLEEYNTKEEATKRELYIKSRKGKLNFELNHLNVNS
ncbi:MAG: GIY-YIG nuclease family protein [Ignavibacteriales bacterium]|nr:GIY-YIG nuclease family protein [Ignavibacteriales bacterium]